MKTGEKPVRVEIAKKLPKEARTVGQTAAKKPKQARTVFLDEADLPVSAEEKRTNDAGVRNKSAAASAKRAGSRVKGCASSDKETGTKGAKRAKARKPNEKITPASIFSKMMKFGKVYQIENEQDFMEAARIYAEEAGLIDQMRDQIAEEGLTVMKTYKTGDVPVAHPLLSELPRHVESANRCLATIGTMIGERGARVEKAARDLDAFRLH